MSYNATVLARTQSWKVRVNLDGEDWQLFTASDKPACDAAAIAINRGIEALALTGATKYSQYVKLLKPFAELGACDTEPEIVLQHVLQDLGILSENEDRFSN